VVVRSARSSHSIQELLTQDERFGIDCVQPKIDGPLRRKALVSIPDRVHLDLARRGEMVSKQLDERPDASKIRFSILIIAKHPIVVFDRLHGDHRRKAAAATGVRTDETNCRKREPLAYRFPRVLNFLDTQIGRAAQRLIIRRGEVEHQAHVVRVTSRSDSGEDPPERSQSGLSVDDDASKPVFRFGDRLANDPLNFFGNDRLRHMLFWVTVMILGLIVRFVSSH